MLTLDTGDAVIAAGCAGFAILTKAERRTPTVLALNALRLVCVRLCPWTALRAADSIVADFVERARITSQ